MNNLITATVVTTRRELQHYHHHNTTQVSTKKERKGVERIRVTKRRKKINERNREGRMVGMH